MRQSVKFFCVMPIIYLLATTKEIEMKNWIEKVLESWAKAILEAFDIEGI